MQATAPDVHGDHHAGELDELTFRRAQHGDEEACRALVARYQRPLFQLLWRMLEQDSDRQTVEDLTQETFLRVFDALGRFSYEGPARLSTWILTIGTRLALNEARRRSRSPVVPVAEPGAGVQAAQQADETLRRRRLGRAIGRALAQLPPEARAVLVLREYHELEYAEIARACGIEAGTVKSRLSRARAAMRRSLSEVRDDV